MSGNASKAERSSAPDAAAINAPWDPAWLDAYYGDSQVRRRILEFLGMESSGEASCVYFNSSGPETACISDPLEPDSKQLEHCWNTRQEIFRSLWDRHYLLVHFDMEYVNFDDPNRTYREREKTFRLQEEVVQALSMVLDRFEIEPLHIMSGRGHHFVWQIANSSEAFSKLIEIGRVPQSVLAKCQQPLPPRGETISADLARAYGGLALVLEHVVHLVFRALPHPGLVPLTLTAVETRSATGERECISLDLSEYGDPLHTRSVRVPFSVYYKSVWEAGFSPASAGSESKPLFMLPCGPSVAPTETLEGMRNSQSMQDLASRVSARIPDLSGETLALIQDYKQSSLARFHDWYYSLDHDPPERWPHTYDATSFDPLPPSARIVLCEPNDLILKPACLRHLVRVLLALGWHPRHIAGLVRSKLERDYGWGYRWFHYDAALRADFYCRLFAGAVVCGLDNLEDFHCPPIGRLPERALEAEEDLAPLKHSLAKRLAYDRLASRPLHGLFL